MPNTPSGALPTPPPPPGPAPGQPPVGTPAAATVPSGRTLREALLRGMPADELTQTFGGTPQGRRVYTDDIDLTGVDYPNRLVLQYCDFKGAFVAEDARFKNTVDLSYCTFSNGLNLAGAVCEGGLNLLYVRAKGIPGEKWPSSIIEKEKEQLVEKRVELPVALLLHHIRVRRNLRLASEDISGTVLLVDSRIEASLDVSGLTTTSGDLDLQGCTIGGDLFCRTKDGEQETVIGGRVWMSGAKVGMSADFSGATIHGPLDMHGCKIDGNLFCLSVREDDPDTVIKGYVSMMGASVGRDADFRGATIEGQLILNAIHIKGSLNCSTPAGDRHATTVGECSLNDATVDGYVTFMGATIEGALFAQNCHIKGTLFCRTNDYEPGYTGKGSDCPRTSIGKFLWLMGATIDRNLELSGLEVLGRYGEDFPALEMSNVKIGGSLEAHSPNGAKHKTEINGDVSLNGARIEGEAYFVGADIKGGFSAVRAEFDDGLFFASGSADLPESYKGDRGASIGTKKFRGLDLTHCQVNANLSLSGLTVNGPVNLHGIHVAGDIDARSTEGHTTTFGLVTADNMRAKGNFDFQKVKITPEQGKRCLDIGFAEIEGKCVLPQVVLLSIHHANIGELCFTEADFPETVAHGMTFRRLQFGLKRDAASAGPARVNPYIRFLNRTYPFQRGVYHVVEKYLRDQGHDPDADLVFREMKRRDRREEAVWLLYRIDTLLWGGREVMRRRDAPPPAAPPVAPGPKRPPRLRRYVSTTSRTTLSCCGWLGQVFLDITTGYGTRSIRLGLYLIAVSCAMFFLFVTDHESVKRSVSATAGDATALLDKHEKELAPEADPEVRKKAEHIVAEKTDPKVPPCADDWGVSEAGMMTFRVTFPMLKIVSGKEWEPADKPVAWKPLSFVHYDTLAGFVGILSYLAVPLFLVSVSGFLKRRGE